MTILAGVGKSLRTFFYSIRFRLVLWFTAILALILFAFNGFVYLSQARDIRGEAMFRQDHKMTYIIQLLGKSNGVIPADLLQEQDIFVLLDNQGDLLASQGINSDQDISSLISSTQHAIRQNVNGPNDPFTTWIEERGPSHTHYLFIAKPVSVAGRIGVAILGSPFDPYDLNTKLLVTLLIGSGLTLAIAVGGGLWLADRAMRPVQMITQAARTISETDLNRRINLKSKDELGELANTFDGMLARLQTAFERQRQFVADASHELRTPLTIVNLETGRALASQRSPKEYERALGVISSENEFMTHLVNDLLMLARMDAGQAALKKSPVDLSDLALEAVERLMPLAERNNIHLETGDLPEVTIEGDRQYLLQMLSNLIENGIKYTGGDDRRVKVETGQTADSLWVRVSDTGVGIPPEHLPHLFDRFYRVDKARARDSDDHPSGSGLGLSIAQKIAQAHDGEIVVNSEVGQGTIFEVRFKTK